MSADRWGVCPKCKKEKERKLKNAYGNVSQDEYNYMKADYEKENNTLREDYVVYIDSDVYLIVEYSCKCSVCGFSHEFGHMERIIGGKNEDS